MHIGMTVGYLIGGILAEIVAHTANYKSKKMNILSYVYFLPRRNRYIYRIFHKSTDMDKYHAG